MQKDTHLCTAGISKPTATQSTDTAESYSLLAIWPPAVRGNWITAAAKKLISLPLWGSRVCTCTPVCGVSRAFICGSTRIRSDSACTLESVSSRQWECMFTRWRWRPTSNCPAGTRRWAVTEVRSVRACLYVCDNSSMHEACLHRLSMCPLVKDTRTPSPTLNLRSYRLTSGRYNQYLQSLRRLPGNRWKTWKTD